MKQFVLILMVMACLPCESQEPNQAIQSGNEFYRKQQYEQAEKEYASAVKSQPGNNTAKFNLANSGYRLGKQDEAIKSYEEISAYESEPGLKSRAYYNKGVILSKQKKLEESIEAYKNALRQNPDDLQARENLQKALLELKKKEPPKQKDQKKKEQKKQQQQPKMDKKEAEQRLKLLEQKEKEVQQKLQRSKTGVPQPKDW